MHLADYLETCQLSQQAFAKSIGVTQGLVWQWLRGHKRITAERALQIEAVTDGQVRRHDLRPDLFDPPAEEAA